MSVGVVSPAAVPLDDDLGGLVASGFVFVFDLGFRPKMLLGARRGKLGLSCCRTARPADGVPRMDDAEVVGLELRWRLLLDVRDGGEPTDEDESRPRLHGSNELSTIVASVRIVSKNSSSRRGGGGGGGL